MSKALHLIMVASCQAEGSKCINGIHPSFFSLLSSTCAQTGGPVIVAVQRQTTAFWTDWIKDGTWVSYRNIRTFHTATEVYWCCFPLPRSISLLSSAVFTVYQQVSHSLFIFFFSCFLQNVLIWINSVMRKWGGLERTLLDSWFNYMSGPWFKATHNVSICCQAP